MDFSVTRTGLRLGRAGLGVIAALSLAMPAAALAAPGASVDAASGSLTITSVRWAKKKLDTTLIHKGAYAQAKLSLKVRNTVKGSNCVMVTIQNTKSKVKLTAHGGKSGGSVFFQFAPLKAHAGTWKVVSISAAKRTTKKVGTQPGYWLPWGRWQGPTDVFSTTYKSLKTVKRAKPSIKVLRGTETNLTMSSPTSLIASATTATFSATLKTDKGKPVVGQTVRIQLVPGKTPSLMSSSAKPIVAMATTDANGVARATIAPPRAVYGNDEFRGFTASASFAGRAKKLCVSDSALLGVSQPKEKTAFTVAPTWDGHTGHRTFSATLAVSGGPNNGKAVTGVPIEWVFWREATMAHTDENAVTDASGVTKTTWTLGADDWTDYRVVIGSKLNSMLATPYAPPTSATYQLAKSQGTKSYTVDMGKIQLLGGSDPSPDWFTLAPTAAGKAFITVASLEGLLTEPDGTTPLSSAIGVVTPKALKVSLLATEGTSGFLAQDKAMDFSLNQTNSIPLKSANRISVDSSLRTATKIQVTLELPTFERAFFPEYRYVPLTPTISQTLP